MDFHCFDSLSRNDGEKYAQLVHVVQKIIFLADELIEQNCFLTKYVQELEGQHLSAYEMPTRDLLSAFLRNCNSQRNATGDQAKLELLMEAISNLSDLSDLFVARNNYLIKCICAHTGEYCFDFN